MKKYIRKGFGNDIETFLERFFEKGRLYDESGNGCIRAWRLVDSEDADTIILKLKVRLGNRDKFKEEIKKITYGMINRIMNQEEEITDFGPTLDSIAGEHVNLICKEFDKKSGK